MLYVVNGVQAWVVQSFEHIPVSKYLSYHFIGYFLFFNSCSDDKMTAILDQKHYIEELNRHLSGTVTDLQAKMDSIEKTNSKLVEEV